VLIARRAHLLEELGGQLRRCAPSLVLPLDLSHASRIAAAVTPTLQETGAVAVLVNSAGFGIYRRVVEQNRAIATAFWMWSRR
jgi:short-subunit dehydrogenase